MNVLNSFTNPQEKKQFVGNAIYQIIEQSFNQNFAGRITGMLIDESVIKFEDLLTNQKYFTEKSYEAYNLLMAQQMQMQQQQLLMQAQAAGQLPPQ